jgi:sugar lactone lactonase YvrE
MYRKLAVSVLLVLVTGTFDVNAGALSEGEVEVVADFDATFGEYPEGVAVDKEGNIFLSMAYLGEIWKVTPTGDLAVFYSALDGSGAGVLGLAVDAPGNIYAAVASGNQATQGVYRISRDGTSCELIPGTDSLSYADGLAFDKRGTLYITEADDGAIYRVTKSGFVELWLQDDLLEGTGLLGLGVPIGANGIQFWKNSLVVPNTEKFLLVRVPILADGNPGDPTVLYDASLPDPPFFWFVPDGIALDVHGNIYVADPALSQIIFVTADGSWASPMATALDGSSFDNPTSLAFGTGDGDRKNVYIVNFDLVADPLDTGPSLVKMGAGVPGNPLR